MYCWYFFGECLFEVAELIPLSHFRGDILVVLTDDFHDFHDRPPLLDKGSLPIVSLLIQ